MTFTELEYALMIAVAVLLWRGAILTAQRDRMRVQAERYALYLIEIYAGRGKVVKTEDGSYTFARREHENSKQT